MQVKPTDSFSMGQSPLNATSTYSKEFGAKVVRRHKSLKTMDNLKSGGMWMGKSVYNMKFESPKKGDYAKNLGLRSRSEKVLKTLDYSRRFSNLI